MKEAYLIHKEMQERFEKKRQAIEERLEEAHLDFEKYSTRKQKDKAIAAAIISHYGAKHQLLKLAEECAELTQQCMKCFDLDLSYSEDFVEELADVRIMIMQFESILSGSWGELYEKIITEKLERQMKRINDE